MHHIDRMMIGLLVRWHTMTSTTERDRGDNPVPTSIIIAGLALLAVTVVAWAVARATGFMNTAPGGGPAAPGGQ